MKPTPADLAVASMPTLASISLGNINSLVGIVGGLLGIAYLIWKWLKEANKP